MPWPGVEPWTSCLNSCTLPTELLDLLRNYVQIVDYVISVHNKTKSKEFFKVVPATFESDNDICWYSQRSSKTNN